MMGQALKVLNRGTLYPHMGIIISSYPHVRILISSYEDPHILIYEDNHQIKSSNCPGMRGQALNILNHDNSYPHMGILISSYPHMRIIIKLSRYDGAIPENVGTSYSHMVIIVSPKGHNKLSSLV